MFWIRAAGAIVAGGLLMGCAGRQTPAASSGVQPVSAGTYADLEQSWQAAHPGSFVGHVNEVIPEHSVCQVAGLPLDQIQVNNIVTILPRGNATITAKVFDKRFGYVQLDYTRAGGLAPRIGDLAVWYPGGVMPPDQTTPVPGPSAPTIPPAPATATPAAETPTNPPTIPPPPTTTSSEPTPVTPPTSTPTAPSPDNSTPAPAPTTTPAPSSIQTPPPPPPADNSKPPTPPTELNK